MYELWLPYFALPEGVEDLFSDTEEEEDDDLILKGRYKATSSMGSSSKWGVYRCLDLETNTEVIVKEARPFVNRSRKNPHDTVECLRNEYRVLERLQGTGVTPRPIELFQEWEHSFLAMELVKGMPLAPYLARWPASLVLFFSQLGDEKYRRAAVDTFDHIKPKLRSDRGGYCYDNTEAVYHGLAHGAAGIGHFMLQLHRATGKAEHLDVAKGLLDFELASAEKDVWGHVAFKRSTEENLHYPYFRIGSAGIGAVALRFHEALEDDRYLEMARRIARSLAGGYTVFPTNLAGMVGIGNFFVDMHRRTEEPGYLEEARRFVDRVMLFAIEKPSGIVFPGEELVRISTDYGTGSAGTGMFLHRIFAGGGIPYLDF